MSVGDGGGQLGLLRGNLVEDLFLIELGEDLALADGVVDVGIELGDDAAGLGLDLDFGDGLDLAGGDDGAGDVADLNGSELGGINGGSAAEGSGRYIASADQYAGQRPPGWSKAACGISISISRGLRRRWDFALRSVVTQIGGGRFRQGEK